MHIRIFTDTNMLYIASCIMMLQPMSDDLLCCYMICSIRDRKIYNTTILSHLTSSLAIYRGDKWSSTTTSSSSSAVCRIGCGGVWVI